MSGARLLEAYAPLADSGVAPVGEAWLHVLTEEGYLAEADHRKAGEQEGETMTKGHGRRLEEIRRARVDAEREGRLEQIRREAADGTVRYRSHTIYCDPPPIPIRDYDWCYEHDEYDGAPDSGDNRCGVAASVAECKAMIDDALADENGGA